jgi:hypothetical protein
LASPTLGSSANMAPISAPIFQQDRFTVERRRIFSFMLRFHFRDSGGHTLAFLPRKPLGWKEEIRLFTDETLSMELLSIKASKITDAGVTFQVTDSINRQKVGTLQRSGWSWLIAAEWTIMDANGQEIGKILEQSTFLGRFLGILFPRRYAFKVREQQVGIVTEKPKLLGYGMDADFSQDSARLLDRRLATAAIVLILAVEEALK